MDVYKKKKKKHLILEDSFSTDLMALYIWEIQDGIVQDAFV